MTLLTIASFNLLDEAGHPLEERQTLGTNEIEVFTAPSDWPGERIVSTSDEHDRYQPCLSEEAEARRQEELKRAREQKAGQARQPFPLVR